MGKRTPVLFISILLLLTATPVHAQDRIDPVRHLKVGLTFSQLQNTEWKSSAAPGFVLGLSLDFRLSDLFSVQPEVLYVEKGGYEHASSAGTEFDLTMDYIEVPLLAKFHLPTDGLFRPHAYLGPYAGFLIAKHSNTEILNDNQFTPDDLIRRTDNNNFGAVFGIGTDMHFTFNTIRAEIRYSAGLSDAFNSDILQKIRTGSLIFMIGFNF